MPKLIFTESLQKLMETEHQWKFERGGLMSLFNSPKMKSLFPIPLEDPNTLFDMEISKEDLLKLEIKALLAEKEKSMREAFEPILKDVMNQYRLHLERGLEPPETLTVSFDVNFENL